MTRSGEPEDETEPKIRSVLSPAIEQGAECIPNGSRFADIVQIDDLIDLAGNLRHGEQARRPGFTHGDRLGAGGQKHLVLDFARHIHVAAGCQHFADGADRIEPGTHPAHTHIGHGRDEDQNFGDQHCERGQQQELA